MLFLDALKQLEAGVAMRRAAWPVDEGYLKLMPGMNHVWKIVLVPNPNAGNFIFSMEDFNGCDWEELSLVKEVEPVIEEVEIVG